VKRWQERFLWIIALVAMVYGMVYVDVVWRAKESFLEGEKYWRWADHPEERQQFLDTQLTREKAVLENDRSRGKLSPDEVGHRLEIAQFDHDQALKESSIKYAYIWYQTTADLFSPPESRWVKMAREKMPVAKERWKAELRARKIPFEDYMID
jgi:hypothetical protein